MGNSMAACCITSEGSSVEVIFWEGNKRILTGKRWLAGEIMFEFPNCMVCDAGCFFIGHPIPALAIDDQLKPGQTYFVLPLDMFSSKTLAASSISALAAYTPNRSPVNFKECLFEYIKGSNGRVLIKVTPEFMARILTRTDGNDDQKNQSTNGFLCSTPELKKQYEQLVGSKDQNWSPKLETISEHNKMRSSPYRFIGLRLESRKREDGA
ncbi:uncharacterized protein LOC112500642 [Cynara cardunculus var. scolymus]|uniref:DUF4228 domain-containing protein n=1 Tax=Cynara cardunculus var. scolymus TaxID=59895 RepID=A0A103YFL0_CYNCS|nr:uncharacterized protein LOC112500642 [Cynara cardunculus var. scolymus]KVI08170.1 Protein of unknown function DUF4228 [Cynara cardunculus var. scolymus]